MLRLFSGKPCLGIEITASAIRLAALTGRGSKRSVLSMQTVALPDDLVGESYASTNLHDLTRVSTLVRDSLDSSLAGVTCAALSLPDSIFRVQTLEFDTLPSKAADRERLIRWRLEKGAAFDISDTALRYQVLRRQDKGMTVLASVAKKTVLDQYESLLRDLGLEPWSIGLSSLNTLNFYSPIITRSSAVSALAHITEGSFTTAIIEAGGVRFYRYKEVKRGGAGDLRSRFMREIEDSLHFYAHMDRAQQSEVSALFLTGESSLPGDLAEGLRAETSLVVEVPSPSSVIPSAGKAGPEMAAALGAGSSL